MFKNYIDIYHFFIKKRLVQLWGFLGLAFLLALLGAPVPYLLGYLIDTVIPTENTELLLKVVSSLALLMLVQIFITYINSVLTFKAKKEITVDTIQSMLNGIFEMSYEKRSSLHVGEIISRLTRDVGELYYILPFGIANLVYRLLFSLMMAAILLYINWKLSVMLLFLLPFIAVIYFFFNKALWDFAFKDANASANNMKFLNEVITADFEIKSYGAQNKFKQLAMKAVRHYQKTHYKRLIVNERLNASVSLFPVIATIIVWYFASLMAIRDEISIGLIITYTASISLIVPSIMRIVEHIAEYPNQVAVFRRVEAFSKRIEPKQKQNTTQELNTINSLRLEKIKFAYQGSEKQIFDDFSYQFNKGNIYLIKAPNGFGKSTLFSLLSKHLSPSSGQIYLDQTPLSLLSDSHQYITLLPQQVNIISDTIRNNLSFGDASLSDENILDMLHHLGLKGWVNEKKQGLDHILTLSRQQLSGGQIQRIGLARAFLRKSNILLLDEPTNNLDNNAVNHLINTITSSKEHRIILIISHDDRIYPHVDETLKLAY